MFNSEKWNKLSPYLDQALAFDEERRSDWLASLRQTNPQLGAELESLLHEHSALGLEGFLEEDQTALPSSSGLIGQIIGPYTLVSKIGQGGMGSVWLADRSDGLFECRVAVKLLGMPLVGWSAEQRFRREGRILGHLVHPHIAELLDAGVSGSGQPYLVLEYIEGDWIDRYCDRWRLDLKARIRLFLDVLEAVGHAHNNLVVHRDIKPSNVLVADDGRVKLLDFGIAKLLERNSDDTPLLTLESGRLMTPEYAAPEQLEGGRVTTATDVYALGVLLYLLLTGQHPAGEARSPADLVRAIVDKEPQRASEIVSPARWKETCSTTAAARRSTTPERLPQIIRGDLDTIVAKALKKDPLQRYGSVTALANDLRRYLENQPITARPENLLYNAGKFVGRHATTAALISFATLSILAALTAAIFQVRTRRRPRGFGLF